MFGLAHHSIYSLNLETMLLNDAARASQLPKLEKRRLYLPNVV
jgi:hypothetical protein